MSGSTDHSGVPPDQGVLAGATGGQGLAGCQRGACRGLAASPRQPPDLLLQARHPWSRCSQRGGKVVEKRRGLLFIAFLVESAGKRAVLVDIVEILDLK